MRGFAEEGWLLGAGVWSFLVLVTLATKCLGDPAPQSVLVTLPSPYDITAETPSAP